MKYILKAIASYMKNFYAENPIQDYSVDETLFGLIAGQQYFLV